MSPELWLPHQTCGVIHSSIRPATLALQIHSHVFQSRASGPLAAQRSLALGEATSPQKVDQQHHYGNDQQQVDERAADAKSKS